MFPIPLLALLMAQRQGDAPQDAAKAAMMAAVIRPPMGLMVAIAMAARAAKTPTPPPPPQASGGGSGSGSSGGPSPTSNPSAKLERALNKLGTDMQKVREDREEVFRRVEELERRINTKLGRDILAEVAPMQRSEQVPSFLKCTKAQARAYAQALGLNEPTFVEDADTVSGVVVDQRPTPGEKWSPDRRDVTLELA